MAAEQRKRKPLKLTDEPLVDPELEAYDKMVEIFTEEVPGLLEQVMIPGEISKIPSEYHKPERSKKQKRFSENRFGQ